MSTTDKWNPMSFFALAEEQLEPTEFKALRTVFDYFRKSGDTIEWGPRKNVNGGFQIAFKGIRHEPILYGYADGCLSIYTQRLDSTSESQRHFKEHLENFLQNEFSSNTENVSHCQLFIET